MAAGDKPMFSISGENFDDDRLILISGEDFDDVEQRCRVFWSELLPGIEEFLCTDLAEECLSESAEAKRQYFIERFDILKLPPTLPPRRPVSSSQSSPLPLSSVTEIKSPTLSQDTFFEDPDFAAHQREISRSLASNDQIDGEDEKEVKVYDDIDTGQGQSEAKGHDSSGEHDGVNFYEIPVVKESQPTPVKSEDTNGYEETTNQKAEPEVTEVSKDIDHKPPPLPPRRERTASDAHSRSSIGSLLEEKPPDLSVKPPDLPVKPPDLPVRRNLPKKSGLLSENSEKHEKSDIKSEKSGDNTDDFTDDADATSYESYDEQEHDIELMNKLDIKLPKPLKKNKKHKKLSKSRSSKEWDVHHPYNSLEDVTLSGELQYKGKLSWTKKIAALCGGRMVCYKPDKTDVKPGLVIQLFGYHASYHEKENKKGYDIKLTHPELEVHSFSVDFKDWAQMWCDYICAMAQGKQPPGHYFHLARTTTFSNGLDNSYSSRSEHGASISNLSTASSDGLDLDYSSASLKRGSKKNSRKRMGTIAFRATQFFETIGKKGSKKQQLSGTQSPSLSNLRERSSSGSSAHLMSLPSSGSEPKTPLPTPVSDPDTPVFPMEMGITQPIDCHIQHRGHLNIYSSFNKRKWGRRWCLIRDNKFECYRNNKSTICELDFLLHNCILRRAVEETKSQLGLMLLERECEKITVEPLSNKEMGRWLKILMNETATENLPEGLSEFWVEEDESPYHDIKPEEITSPKSDGCGYAAISNDDLAKTRFSSSCDTAIDSPCSDGNKTLTISVLENTADLDTPTTCQVSEPEQSNSYIPGEVTGDLYTQVRKSSISEELVESNCSSTFSEEHRSFKSHVQHTSKAQWKSFVSSHTKSNTFFFSESEMKDEDSLFAEILTNINKRFSEHDSEEGEPSSEVQTDTAYNSGTCSENSSLERKNRTDSNSLLHSQNDLDLLNENPEIQTSPQQDNCDTNNERIVEIQVLSHIDQSNERIISVDQSNERIISVDQSNERTSSVDQSDNISSTIIPEQTTLSVESKSSREQCDSAIFEGESFLEDEESLIHKIEQLRTHLVELKKNRISVRDRKLDALSQSQKVCLEDEYNRLDEECKTITDEIALLETQIGR